MTQDTLPALPESIADLPYRLGVGMIVVNGEGKVFAGARIDTPGDAWQMPQGGIDKDENPLEAALRELEEEIGTSKVELVAESEGWLTYDLPPDLQARLWRGRYRGQSQKWFVFRFLGRDDDINIATAHPEFREWKWMTLDGLYDHIVPFKKELYAAVIADLSRHVKPC